MRAISVMIKPASGLCNMRCDYCFYCDEAAKREQESYGLMTEATLKNVIRRTLTQVTDHYTLSFQGGEPTLRGLEFFKQAVAYTRQYNLNGARVQFALQTNGYALTEEWARFFAENGFLIGVSVDGTRLIHDRYRHPAAKKEAEKAAPKSTAEPGGSGGTFDRVLASIRLLEKYGVEYNILTVVHRMTAENIREIYAFYRKQGWDYLQFIPCLDPLGEKPGQKEYSLLPETYGRFLTDLFGLWYEDYKKNRMPYIRHFENYLGMTMGYRPEACDLRGHCGLQYVVEADGSVYPCDFYMLDEWKLGNFNTDRLDAVDEMRHKKRFLERSDELHEDCRSCEWLSMCRGGCFRCRTGIPDTAFPERQRNYFCEGFRMFFASCSEKLRELAVLTAEAAAKNNQL